MNEIAQMVRSPAFWFSTLIVGTVAALVGAFLKDWLDTKRNNLAERRKRIGEERRKKVDAAVAEMMADPIQAIELRIDHLRALQTAQYASIILLASAAAEVSQLVALNGDVRQRPGVDQLICLYVAPALIGGSGQFLFASVRAAGKMALILDTLAFERVRAMRAAIEARISAIEASSAALKAD